MNHKIRRNTVQIWVDYFRCISSKKILGHGKLKIGTWIERRISFKIIRSQALQKNDKKEQMNKNREARIHVEDFVKHHLYLRP